MNVDIKTDQHIRILSLGAGVQSSTLALMIEKGLVPMIDAAIFADTGAEPKKVYEWLNWLEKQVSFPVLRVANKHGSLTDNLIKVNKAEYVRGTTIPMYTRDKITGKKGILRRQCTATYKIEPVTKRIRELLGVGFRIKVPKNKKVTQLFGISKDEVQRMRTSTYHYITFDYPLIDNRMSRADCLKWMENNGYPTPPRSACTYCPYHSNEEWRNVRKDKVEWDAVVKLDKQLRTGLYKCLPEKHNYYLHRSGLPLDEVDLDKEKNSKQLDMEFGMDNACEGMCGV